MARNKAELSVQADLVKSVKKDGGWARKLSHRFMIGLPDLLVGMYPSAPFLAEVKDLGHVGENFRLKLGVSEKQRYELQQFNAGYRAGVNWDTQGNASERYASVLLVGWAWGRMRWVAMLPWDATHLDSSSINREPCAPAVQREAHGYYPIKFLAERFGALHKVKLL